MMVLLLVTTKVPSLLPVFETAVVLRLKLKEALLRFTKPGCNMDVLPAGDAEELSLITLSRLVCPRVVTVAFGCAVLVRK